MNLKNSLLTAALLGGLLSSSAFAVTADAHTKVAKAIQLEAPVVTKVVSPTGLSRRHSETVMVRVSLDAKGQPVNVKIVSHGDQILASSLVPAVSQWEFTPAKKNGVAVPSSIVVPISLVEA